MDIVIRPIPPGSYVPIRTDAISCTYDMDGFTLMNAVLISHRLDRKYFEHTADWHRKIKYLAIVHPPLEPWEPTVITTTSKVRWDGNPPKKE